ncbi:MAG TPA: phosphate ABC transporter permease PstA [Gaiellaceae bacterium]|jgi:phosphate transport system permease protein|nr:phosphate ABC transporter permease PstA [Gaiellaceae bacterium]
MAVDAARYSLTLSRRTKRRKLVNLLMQALATLAALGAVAVLAIVIVSVAQRGVSAISWDFFTKTAATFGQSGGGVSNALVGTLVVVGVATAMSVPVAILIALYVSEFAPPRVADLTRLVLDVLNGLPSIIIGVFVYGLLVLGSGQAAWKGSFALAIIMLPLVSRATQEVLALVPDTLRQGALALGASRWRTVLGVILPTSVGGIITGTVLAVARAAGETAPLLFTTSIAANAVTWDPRQPVLTIPFDIFALSESPDPADHARAWALALVLLLFILATSLTARLVLARHRKKLEG